MRTKLVELVAELRAASPGSDEAAAYLLDHPALRFDHAACVYASVNGMVDPRRPGGYVRSLAAVGVRLAGCRRRLGTSGGHDTA